MTISLRRSDPFQKYRDAIQIDKLTLDDDVIQHSQIFMEISEKLEFAVSRKDQLELELKELESVFIIQMRRTAMEKYTVAELNAMVKIDPACMKAARKLLKVELEAAQWRGLVSSYMQRSSMLKRLVDLYATGYWSRDSINSSREAINERVSQLAVRRK